MSLSEEFSPFKRCKRLENENTKQTETEDDSFMEEDEDKLKVSFMEEDEDKLKELMYLKNESSKKSKVEEERLFRYKYLESEVEEEEEEERLFKLCKYGDTVSCSKKLRGTYLDVISLLSDNGNTNYLVKSDGSCVGLDFVKGKHLVISCVSLPFTDIDDSEASWRAMLDTYSSHNNDFEMVVAVTIKNNEEAVFDDFLSSLPCLAIPFPDLDTRTSICSFIFAFPMDNIRYPSNPTSEVSAIVVNPTGIILHYFRTPALFLNYGFEWFTSNVREIALQDDILRYRLDPFHYKLEGYTLPEAVTREPLSLDKDILLCDPSLMLFTLSGQSSTVSQLSKKYVGLYLCINFHFVMTLEYIHDKCIKNKQELEIVLVCLPIYDKPKLYHEKLLQCPRIKSWFIFPYDNNVSRRLWRVFGFEQTVDRFIIVPPKGKSGGELLGRSVVQHFRRMDIDAYPFTRSAFLEQWLAALKSVTPASLFKGSCETHTCLVQYGRDSNNVVPQSAIKGKNLLLYVDRIQLSDKHTKLYRLLMKHYPKIQAMGCEVVYVPLNIRGNRIPVADDKWPKMPWPMMPVKAFKEAWDTIKLFLHYVYMQDCYVNQLIALGKDGGILSTRVKKELKTNGVNDYLFWDSLREELIDELDAMDDCDDEVD